MAAGVITFYVFLFSILGHTLALDGTVKVMIEKDTRFLSIFRELLANTYTLDELGIDGNWYTVFAPVNEAFEKLSMDITKLGYEDRRQLMKYHTVFSPEPNTRIELRNDQSQPSNALNQPVLWFNVYGDRKTVNGARVISQIDADNGRIYYIDRVLYPRGTKDNTVAYMTKNFNKCRGFHELIMAANLEPLVNSLKMTMFIPNNMALTTEGGLDTTVRENLKKNVPLLQKVIKGHIIEKEIWPLDRLEFVSNIEVTYERHDGIEQQTAADTMDPDTKCTVAKRGEDRYVMCGMVSAKIVEANIVTDSGIVHIIDKLVNYVHSNAHQQIALDGSLSDFRQAMKQETNEELYNYLNQDNGPKVTILAPLNAGFARLNQETMDNLRDDQPFLKRILNLHVIPNEVVMVRNIPIGGEVAFAKSSRAPVDPSKPDGSKIMLRFYRDENDTYVEGGHIVARIIRMDVGVTNGILHYIDHVLGAPYQTLQEAIFERHTNLSQFAIYLRQVNMWPMLGVVDQKFTVFAPTNHVLWKIQRAQPEFFKDPWALKYVIKRHFLNETAFFFDEIPDASEIEVRANNTNKVILQNNGGYQYLLKYTQYAIPYTASVTEANIGCLNGALHVINDWLFVPGSEGDIIGGAAVCRQSYVIALLSFILFFYNTFTRLRN